MAEGGKEEIPSGITEEEERLLQALHLLGIKPKLGTTEDVAKLLQVFGTVKPEPIFHKFEEPTSGSYHYPKLSIFYGEEGKGDVTWTAFKYEIESLVHQKVFSEEQILLGLRRACKGKAADKLCRLGTKAHLLEVIDKFDSDYGSVESRETVMRKFYSCRQLDDETVLSYTSRLEDIFDRGIQLKALKRSDTQILKEVFHAGLRRDLKLMSIYQFDKIDDYDELKREVRKLESSLVENDPTESKTKTCKAAVATDMHTKEMGEVKELLKKLNERIDRLEKEKADSQSQQGFNTGRGRGYRGRGRGFRGRGRGRGEYKPQRPISGQNFIPTCWTCNQKGHLQRDCPSYNTVVCYNCNEPGHKQNVCPKA